MDTPAGGSCFMLCPLFLPARAQPPSGAAVFGPALLTLCVDAVTSQLTCRCLSSAFGTSPVSRQWETVAALSASATASLSPTWPMSAPDGDAGAHLDVRDAILEESLRVRTAPSVLVPVLTSLRNRADLCDWLPLVALICCRVCTSLAFARLASLPRRFPGRRSPPAARPLAVIAGRVERPWDGRTEAAAIVCRAAWVASTFPGRCTSGDGSKARRFAWSSGLELADCKQKKRVVV